MKQKVYIFSMIIILCITSCQKKWQHEYPEDGGRTKDTPKARLCDKNWILKSATFNGIDYTDTVKAKVGNYKMNLGSQEYDSWSSFKFTYGLISTDLEKDFKVRWKFIENDNKIEVYRLLITPTIDTTFAICYFEGFSKDSMPDFTILKLTSNEFKIKLSNANADSIMINEFRIN